MKTIIRAGILCAAVGALFMAGCTTFFPFPVRTSVPRQSSVAPAKGETSSIAGRLEKEKNQYVLTDTKSGISYRFVGLKKSEEALLSPHVGKTVTVKLVVKSTESAKVRIAQFVEIVR
jgi:hypothetical protein